MLPSDDKAVFCAQGQEKPFPPTAALAVLVSILAPALVFRLYSLSERSFWFDEAFAWRLIEFPFPEMLGRAARLSA
jgi:hypothetical protein